MTDNDVDQLAIVIHDEICDDTPKCARPDRHRQFYHDRASAILTALEPSIGVTGVFNAVPLIISELF